MAPIEDVPKENLCKGQVGPVVELLALDAVLAEFSDADGWTHAMLPLKTHQLMGLHCKPTEANTAA